MPRGRPSLVSKIAEKIFAILPKEPGRALPSINALAQKFGVSYQTAKKAIGQLKRRNLVVSRQGGRILSGSADEIKKGGSIPEAVRNFAESIGRRISSGEWRAGNALPKVEYFVVSENVGRTTVCKAFQILAQQKLIYKKGKSWVVGARPYQAGPAKSSVDQLRPTVLLLATNYFSLYRTLNSDFNTPFELSFLKELTKFGFSYDTVFLRPNPRIWEHTTYSLSTVGTAIRKLQNRYSGILVIKTKIEADIDKWMHALCRFNKPVVLLDHANLYPSLTRAKPGYGKLFCRCVINPAQGVKLAAKRLHALGHRRMAYPVFSHPDFRWVGERAELLKKTFREMDMNMEITFFSQREMVWEPKKWTGALLVPDHEEAEKRLDPPFITSSKRGQKSQPSLIRALKKSAATAVVAPNDVFAQQYYFWMRNYSIRIPRDVSLISFDNSAATHFLPVSTIDFGQERLGYMAAHMFIKDVPLRIPRNGVLNGDISLIDKGSLSTAKTR